ncbi:MAG TPA: hydrogenase [Desulfobacteraceae bacterium]|nr:hydrogenase [Desulfobacteraceae bacterium]
MIFFLAAVLLLLLSSLLAPLSRNGSLFWDRLSLVAGLTGCLFGLAAAALCLFTRESLLLSVPWQTIAGSFSLRIDGLSAVFLAPAFLISGAGLLYGSGYWPHSELPGSSAWIRFFYPLLAAGIALVLAADNGVVFLISWEIMALCGYFLVITEREDEQNLRAGLVYLMSTHVGTLALFALFALLGENACLVSLPAAGSLSSAMTGNATILFLLTLVGFGIKGGIMPLHIWLPGAHAAAPSHVSALMSGVMIKTGIYGILRVTSFFHALPAWWGWLILGLGLLSGILGVLFAIAQHDIKRLLAYHSIENIGIILLGTGAAMLGKTHGVESIAVLGMAGALLHVVNHGLFKGLLFLSAGSMIKSTGSRQLSSYGGLLRSMPYTGLFFLGGAIAICGLPPLNGFVSEWFVYLALLRPGSQATQSLNGLLLAVPGLAMIGGLALLCFAKVFGLSFLGTPRTDLPDKREAPVTMLAAMAILLGGCVWIGIAPATVQPMLSGAIAQWINLSGSGVRAFADLAPLQYISISAVFLLLLLLLLFLFSRYRGRIIAERPPTWGCGYAVQIPRAQYSTSSFAEMIMKLSRHVLIPRFEEQRAKGIFPASGSFKSHTPDVVLDRLLIPLFQFSAGIAFKIRSFLQHGVIGIYMLYSALTIIIMLYILL